MQAEPYGGGPLWRSCTLVSCLFSHYFSLDSTSALYIQDKVHINLTSCFAPHSTLDLLFFLHEDKRENNCNNFVLSLSFSLFLLSVFAGPVHLPDIWGVQHRGKSALCLKAVGVNERNDKFLMGSLLKSGVGGV